jgi:hypothetical protein
MIINILWEQFATLINFFLCFCLLLDVAFTDPLDMITQALERMVYCHHTLDTFILHLYTTEDQKIKVNNSLHRQVIFWRHSVILWTYFSVSWQKNFEGWKHQCHLKVDQTRGIFAIDIHIMPISYSTNTWSNNSDIYACCSSNQKKVREV